MAAPTSSSFLGCLILSLCLFCSLEKGFGLQAKHTTYTHSPQHIYTLQLSSLVPASICSPSSTVPNNEATLKVIHKHGPCSQPHQDAATTTIDHHTQILQQDQSRVQSIQASLAEKSTTATDGTRYRQDATTLPAKSGAVVGSGNYIVTVGLGTPKRDLSLIFDTGSDLTWTQCRPCAKSCYNQRETIFDPSKSTTYSNVSCNSADCSQLQSATGNKPGCSSVTSTCIYGVKYGDQSFSIGYLAKDTLTLTSSDVISNFLYGCGQNNQGLFGGSAGLLGLGRSKISIVEQTAQKYNRLFSYCLPSSSSVTGYLSFGTTGGKPVKYTPLTTLSGGESFYALQFLGISVGGKRLSTPVSVFQTAGTIIDSGTVITRLPPTAYSALRGEFRKQMSRYPSTSALSILDTCYDLSGYKTVTIPKISFFLGGGTVVELDATGILYAGSVSQVCLAFAANGDDSDVAILGNVQQKTLLVVYDIGGGRIGFGSGGCS